MTSAASFSRLGPLHGAVRVPGDKSISHRALLLGGLAEGVSRVRGLSDGEDVLATRAALHALGVEFSGEEISGGRAKLHEAERPIDVGNSGTCLRLLSGLLASCPFFSVLIGDASIHRRPMDRVTRPLALMGARIDGRDEGSLAPLALRGGDLRGIDYAPSVPSAQVKGAILFAGLGATGMTTVHEAIATRRHSEELFALAGAQISSGEDDFGYYASVRAGSLSPFELEVPGDPSQAAFLVVAASIVAKSEIVVENVYVGPGRAGFLQVLERMGADIELEQRSATAADIHVRSAALHGTEVAGEEVPGLIDEIPILSIAAACASSPSSFRDAGELRVKESDRIETICAGLAALGVGVEQLPDGFVVSPNGPFRKATVQSEFDHRIAMAFAIAGLVTDEEVAVKGFEAVKTSWPSFSADLSSLR